MRNLARIVRFAATTTASAWTVLLAAAVMPMFIFYDRSPWLGDLNATAGLLGYAVLWLLPVVAGLVAIDTARAGRASRLHLVTMGSGRPDWFIIGSALVPTVVLYLLTWTTMMTISYGRPHDFALSLGGALMPLVHFSALLCAALMGRCIGRLFRVLVAGPAAAIMIFVMLSLHVGGGLRIWQVEGDLTLVGSGYSGVTSSMKVIVLTALSLLLVAVPSHASRQGRGLRLTKAGAVAAALVVFASIGTQFVAAPDHYVELEAEFTACRGASPRLCGPAEYTRAIELMSPVLDELSNVANDSGYESFRVDAVTLRDSHDTTTQTQSLSHGVATIDFSLAEAIQYDGVVVSLDLMHELIDPGECREFATQEQFETLVNDTSAITMTWLALVNTDEAQKYALDLGEEFSTMPPQDVARLLSALADCTAL